MARRKKGLLESIPQEYKTSAFALIFLFLGIITFIGDTKSIVGFQLFTTLTQAFWVYYIWIFSPVLIALAIFLFKERNLHFNSYRAFGLLFFYVSLTTLIGWYTIDYIAVFNLYPYLEHVLGRNPLFFSALIMFFTSLFMLFRFSIVHSALGATKALPSLSDIKESYVSEKKISKTKNNSKMTKAQQRKLAAEEKKIQKENSSLEKKFEALWKEKDQFAKMIQP